MLGSEGLRKGDAVVIWSENSAEWLVALWGTLLAGCVLVPIDFRASVEFLRRVAGKVNARLILVGDEVAQNPGNWGEDEPVRHLAQCCSPEASGGEGKAQQDAAAAGRRLRLEIAHDDSAEIIFTSGTTSEPKGVVITHRNILANLDPIEREIGKYRRYGKPFFPLRFLNLLPLSHMFGQATAAFIPPMLPGVTVFMHGYGPGEIVRQIRSRRVSVLVCVPKVLEMLRDHLLRSVPKAGVVREGEESLPLRWWRYRRVHRFFGWKFWCIVVGAAPLPEEMEEFWTRLGFVVIQGYGLTETAPIVTINHPLRARRGSVGAPIEGVEVRIGEDGEIFVRGENVTPGYFEAPEETARLFQDGWLATGDVGEIDEEGRLTIRGRKKEMIVTPEGLNVYPEDVERVLNRLPGVREAAVVGAAAGGGERPHVILSLDPGADAGAVVRMANSLLEEHQKIRGYSIWREGALPRTEGTRKLKRLDLRRWVGGETEFTPAGASAPSVAGVVARFTGQRTLEPSTTIDELGISSLERVELLMALEEAFQTTLDEAGYAGARTIADIERLLSERVPHAEAELVPVTSGEGEPIEFPAWNRSAPARFIRRISLPTWILPFVRLFAWLRVEGAEHLREFEGPVLFAANHQSHFDTPAILAALPAGRRYHLAPAMRKEYFRAHFHPEQHGRLMWLANSMVYYLVSLYFNAFPLPQREAGTRQTLRYIGELVGEGNSILFFPEGRRTEAGEIAPFRPGVGMIAARLRIPVVPVRLRGLERVLHADTVLPHPGPVRVAFGPVMRLEGKEYAELARRVEEAVRSL